jgi:hypothetical protein
MRDFKKFTSVAIRNFHISIDPKVKGILKYEYKGQKLKVWEDRFDDLALYSRRVTLTKLKYINNNPMKAGLCERSEEYKFCSASFYAYGEIGPLEVLHVEEIL